MTAEVPGTLCHYHCDEPFRTLSDVPEGELPDVLSELALHGPLPSRLRHPDYFPSRRTIEAAMRRSFVASGGEPRRLNPLYFVLGRSPIWESLVPYVIEIPVAAVPGKVLSFTYCDSYYTYAPNTLGGIPIPPQPHRGTLYRREELPEAIARFGLPRGYGDPDEEIEVYIEAQVWDDAVLLELLRSGVARRRATSPPPVRSA